MNLTQLKAEAEKAKTSDIELGFWREDISPDDVLRLVEVARLAGSVVAFGNDVRPQSAVDRVLTELWKALEGMEE